MNQCFIVCSKDGLQKVENFIQFEGPASITSTNNRMSCPQCGTVSRIIDFAVPATSIGMQAAEFLITPDVVDKLDSLKSLARGLTFEDLNNLLAFYSANEDAAELAPQPIKKLLAAMKSGDAQAIVTWLSFIITILSLFGVFDPSEMTPEEIIEIVREYDEQHPDGDGLDIPDNTTPNIAPELRSPPESLDS